MHLAPARLAQCSECVPSALSLYEVRRIAGGEPSAAAFNGAWGSLRGLVKDDGRPAIAACYRLNAVVTEKNERVTGWVITPGSRTQPSHRRMSMPTQPTVLSLQEFRKGSFRGPYVIHLTDAEFATLKRGLKISKGRAPTGAGLHLFPLPSPGGGYVGIPVCGPGEVPVIQPNGQVRCSPGGREDTSEHATPIPGPGCSWGFDGTGRWTCTGTCSGGIRCARSFSNVGGGFFLNCRCPRRVIL